METRLSLTVVAGDLPGRVFFVNGPMPSSLGRSSECTVCLPTGDLSVSRRHCLLEIEGAAASVRDLDSLNGTYVNGVQCPREGGRLLASGDELRVGHTVFLVGLTAEKESAADPVLYQPC